MLKADSPKKKDFSACMVSKTEQKRKKLAVMVCLWHWCNWCWWLEGPVLCWICLIHVLISDSLHSNEAASCLTFYKVLLRVFLEISPLVMSPKGHRYLSQRMLKATKDFLPLQFTLECKALKSSPVKVHWHFWHLCFLPKYPRTPTRKKINKKWNRRFANNSCCVYIHFVHIPGSMHKHRVLMFTIVSDLLDFRLMGRPQADHSEK